MEYDERWQRQQERMARQQERWARRQDAWNRRWERRQERWARRRYHRANHSPAAGIIFSVAIIALGALFLLDNLGILRFYDVFRYWPAILIALGVVRLVDSRGSGSIVAGGLLTGIGALLLLDNLGLIVFDWRIFWPAILIALGILMLFRTTQWAQPPQGSASAPGQPPPQQPGMLNIHAMFTGVDRRIDAQDFRGGQIHAMFGGVEIDLRGAALAEAQATLDVNATFGGVDIQIPATWLVETRGTAVFGGFTDETIPPSVDPSAHQPPKLILTGYAMFGGVTVSN